MTVWLCFIHCYLSFILTAKKAQRKLGITLGSIIGVVAMATIVCFAILVLCFVVPSCPLRKLHSQRYNELSNENNPAGAYAETSFTDVSSSPPLNTLNVTSATTTGITPTGHTLINNPGTDVHAVVPSTVTLATTPADTLASDTLATTPSDTLATTPGEAVSTAPAEPPSSDDDDTSLLDISETTLLIQDADTARRPPQISDTVPSSDTPPPGSHSAEKLPGGEPNLPEADDTNVM